jgi:hypothetical protein
MVEYPQIGVRVDADFLKMIDEWRRKQDDVPTRPEAIRRLVELGLKVKKWNRTNRSLSTGFGSEQRSWQWRSLRGSSSWRTCRFQRAALGRSFCLRPISLPKSPLYVLHRSPLTQPPQEGVDSHLGSEMRQWSWHKGLELDVLAPTVLTIISLVFILLSAAVVRVLGTDIGYKVLYVVIAFSLVLKTMLGWWGIACSRATIVFLLCTSRWLNRGGRVG